MRIDHHGEAKRDSFLVLHSESENESEGQGEVVGGMPGVRAGARTNIFQKRRRQMLNT